MPSGRWDEADAVVLRDESLGWASGRIVLCDVSGGLALRRGRIDAATPAIEELAAAAFSSGEAQRVVPASCVVGPYAVVTGRLDLLRHVVDSVHSVGQTHWIATFGVAPLCRALAHAGQHEQLQRLVALELDAGNEPPPMVVPA